MGLTQKLGTIPLAILTDSSNNVGIGGAANASFKLQVTGATNLTGALSGTSATFSSSVTATSNAIGTFTAIGSAALGAGGNIRLNDTATTNSRDWAIGNAIGAGDYGDLVFINGTSQGATPSSTKMIIKSGGNVLVNANSSTYGAASGYNLGVKGTSGQAFISIARTGQNLDSQGIIFGLDTAAAQLTMIDNLPLTFGTNNAERMRITSGGNVGIGTSTIGSDFKLAVYGSNSLMAFQNANTGQGNGDGFIVGSFGNVDAYLYNYENANIIMGTNATERMRITSGGELYWNLTGASGGSLNGGGVIFRNNSGKYVQISTGVTIDTGLIYFYKSDGAGSVTNTGSIATSGNSTVYNTTSDYRLKQDFQDYYGLRLISKIKTYDYEWKSDKTRMFGVIAHELAEVLPYAVTGKKDAEEMQSVDYSKLVPILVKAIQEQQAQIEELKELIKNK